MTVYTPATLADPEQLLKLREAAELVGLTVSTLRTEIRKVR